MATAAIPSASPEPARRGPAFLIVAALLCAVVIVDPVREFMSQDDGWAYARSVEHLLRTGEYRLDAWSAANNPVQIYLAAGLAEIFGHSLGLLRLSTLMLLVASLAALYGLLRRGSLPAWPAAVLTLGLLASPLVLMLSFTFMSDIQFMGWMLIALWLYKPRLRVPQRRQPAARLDCGRMRHRNTPVRRGADRRRGRGLARVPAGEPPGAPQPAPGPDTSFGRVRMAAARRSRHPQLPAGGEAARASVFPWHCGTARFALASFQVEGAMVRVLQRQTPQSAEAEPCPAPAVSP